MVARLLSVGCNWWTWCVVLSVGLISLWAPSLARAQDVSTYTLAPPVAGTAFVPLVGGTPVTAVQVNDALSGALPLGFNFVFDGTPYTQVKASSNGFLTFNPAASSSAFINSLATGAAPLRPLAAPLWDDLSGTDGTATYATTGTAPNRVFTFEWLNWRWWLAATGPVISFQAKLYETTNHVEFVYQQQATPVSNGSASIGLSGAGTGAGSFLSLGDATATPLVSSTIETTTIAAKPATGQVYRFVPGAAPGCPAPRTLAVGMITSTTAPVSWISASTGNTYTVEYGPVGFAPGSATGIRIQNLTGTSYTITGLTPSTAYNFYVTQNCGTNGNSPRSGPVAFTTLALPPANDNCATAVLLTAGTNCAPTSGTVLAATQSLAAGSCGIGSPPTTAVDVWYQFVATAASQVVQVTSLFTPVLDVRSGACATSASIACGTGSRLAVPGLTVGTTYYLRIYSSSFAPTTPTFTVCVTAAPQGPANDDCTTARALAPLTVGGGCTYVPATNVGATATPNVPAPGCASYDGGDVWYSLVVPASGGVITVQTDSVAGSPVNDTGLAFYSGACTGLALLGCDDDSSPNGLFSKYTLTGRAAGEIIYVRVWEYGNNIFGRFKVCAAFDVAPTNDEPAGAVTLTLAADCLNPVPGSNTVASTTPPNGYTNPGGCGPNSTPKDVWYKFTTLASGRGSTEATITVAGAGIGAIRLFTAPTAAGPFGPVAGGCAASASASGVAGPLNLTTLTPGTTYYVQVSNFSNFDGGVPFTICLTAPSNCPIPVGLAATAAATTVILTWSVNSPTPNGTFTLEYGPQNFPLGSGTRITGIAGATRTLTGLTPDTPYCFYVRQECGPASGNSAFAGPICFRTTLAPTPNDEPCTATLLTAAGPTTASNVGATTTTPNGYANPGCSTASAPKDVWFRYAAPAGAHEWVVTGNPAGQVRVFGAASCSGPFTQVVCQASAGPNTPVGAVLVPALTAGTTYYLSVSGFGSSDFQGSFSIQQRVLATGRGELAQGEVSVYPNPSHDGTLTLRLRGANGVAAARAALFNSLGQPVLSQVVTLRGGAAEQALPVRNLAKGFYTLRLQVGQTTITRKVILD